MTPEFGRQAVGFTTPKVLADTQIHGGYPNPRSVDLYAQRPTILEAQTDLGVAGDGSGRRERV
ncbi:UNVERIFIED_CONTAM: hypothetical protein ABIE34_001220 [Jeotgalibacillus campisalis]